MPSLRSLLTRPVSTDLNSVGRYLDQIASALTYAHERTVLHRNLSTRSILLQADRQPIVAEFGLLYMHQLDLQLSNVAQNEQKSMTYEGSSESSAPELLLGKQSEVATDVYALGAVLYRMLTGSPPFVGKTPEAVASQHLHAQVPALRAWRSGLPTELDPVIERALAKEPSLRFQSPEALVEAYYRAVSLKKQPGSVAASIAPMPSASVETVSQDYAAHSRTRISRRYFVAAGLVAGTVTVGTIVVLMSNNALSNSNGAVPTAAPTSAAQATQPTAAKQATQPPPAATPAPARNVLARANDVPLNSAKTFPIANQQNPGLLIHLPNKFVAFDSTCTHAGCAVSYNQGSHLLNCPCHGAIFDPAKNAAVVQGPATSPLNPVKITVHPDGTITTP
jgi:serine/threonine protein kinase